MERTTESANGTRGHHRGQTGLRSPTCTASGCQSRPSTSSRHRSRVCAAVASSTIITYVLSMADTAGGGSVDDGGKRGQREREEWQLRSLGARHARARMGRHERARERVEGSILGQRKQGGNLQPMQRDRSPREPVPKQKRTELCASRVAERDILHKCVAANGKWTRRPASAVGKWAI